MILQQYLDFALDAAFQAGRLTLGYFQRNIHVEKKEDTSPVTLADRQAEELLRTLIAQRYPEDGIIGEESGEKTGTSSLTWILDPIDGTRSFIHGVPLYGVLIALVEKGYPLLGVLHFPALGESVYAARELGCFWNGRRVSVSRTHVLETATVVTSGLEHWWDTPDKQCLLAQLVQRTWTQRTWGDAYGYALVATGRADVMVDPKLSVWDTAPLPVVLEEAGGVFTDWSGQVTIYAQEGLGTNPELYEQVRAILQDCTSQ